MPKIQPLNIYRCNQSFFLHLVWVLSGRPFPNIASILFAKINRDIVKNNDWFVFTMKVFLHKVFKNQEAVI